MTKDEPKLPSIAVPRRALTDDVYDSLLARLMDHSIAPGARISIDGVARDLGVSQTPVREALARLESDELVVKRPLHGYTAAPLLDRDGFRQMHEVRLLLEPEAAALAAKRMTPKRVDELRTVVREMRETPAPGPTGASRRASYARMSALDARFHELIATWSGNPLLADAINRLKAHRHNYRLFVEPEMMRAALGEHNAILAALRNGDAELAAAAMRDHLVASSARQESTLEEPGRRAAGLGR